MNTKSKPRSLLRWFLRTPIWLYRWGLGGLMGGRFLLLTHRGRKSGLPRQTVLEVVFHDPTVPCYYVASGWGPTSDWFQNLHKTPQVEIMVGRQSHTAVAHVCEPTVAGAVFQKYAEKYPTSFAQLGKVMMGEKLPPTAESCQKMAAAVPLVQLALR